jgi:hypothetical protein
MLQFLKFSRKPLLYRLNVNFNIIFIHKMEKSTKVSEQTIHDLSDMAHKLRIHSIEMTDASASG